MTGWITIEELGHDRTVYLRACRITGVREWGGCSHVMLDGDGEVRTKESVDSLQRRIDKALGLARDSSPSILPDRP